MSFNFPRILLALSVVVALALAVGFVWTAIVPLVA